MKSIIADAARIQSKAGVVPERPSSITTDDWVKPHAGWLYVLDPEPSEPRGAGSRVWLVDPEAGTVMGSIRAGDQADMALSRDGAELYIVSGERESGELAVIDTATGSAAADQVAFVCPSANSLRMVRLDADQREKSNTVIALPWSRRSDVAGGFRLPGDRGFALVRGDGSVGVVNTNDTREPSGSTATAEACAGSFGPDQGFVFPLPWGWSADGGRFFVGFGAPTADSMATASELRVFDTVTWRRVGEVRTSVPFWSAVADRGGRVVYALAPKVHSVLVMDVSGLRETRAIRVGGTAVALVAP